MSIVSVNVALPTLLGRTARGDDVWSGIAKRPVAAASLRLTALNLDGDRQADLTVHGGHDKAVYAYSADLFPAWSAESGQRFGPGAFGENVTVSGATEASVFVGDRWSWGDAVLEVAQPRLPCFKLAMYCGTPEIGRSMMKTGRTGWYLRVLRPGIVPTAGSIEVQPHVEAISVADAYQALHEPDSQLARRVKALPELAAGWIEMLESRSST